MSKITTQQAVEQLCKALKNDKGYRLSWEANIAMAFKDQFNFSGHAHDVAAVHEVANKAAAAFINQLIGKDMGDADGMAVIAKLHAQAKPLAFDENIIERFFDNIGIHGLDLAEIVMQFESEFNIQIPNNKVEKIKTLGEFKAMVAELINEKDELLKKPRMHE